jgi:hypothetical protein
MHMYLQKVEEKYFKCLLSTFSDKPQSSISNSYLHVFRKSHEEITEITQPIFRAVHVTNAYQALRHTDLVLYMRPTLIRRYDTPISCCT